MLHVQTYLQDHSLDELAADFAINVYHHPDQPLVGLKYSQIESPKTHPVVRNCRGIVLDKSNEMALVARSFDRFFNAGEVADEFATFNWQDFYCNSKEDGSLIILYFYNKEWRVNTSGSFGLGEVQFSDKTWHQLFWDTSGIDRRDLCEDFTYIFELCTPWNKVVRKYDQPKVFLLSMFQETIEMPPGFVDDCAKILEVPRPESFHFESQDEIKTFLIHKEDTDPTYEGVIIRDDKNLRFKIKTKTYTAYHHLMDNGNLMNPKRLVPLILAGEYDEVVAIFPECKDRIEGVREQIDNEWIALSNVWWEFKGVEDQKQFALSIYGKTYFTSILFDMKKKYGTAGTEEQLRLEWRSEPERIVKRLFR